MADNFDQATVQPSIPAALISPLELQVLEAFGLEWQCEEQADGGPAYYLYTPESFGLGQLTVAAADLKADDSGLADILRDHISDPSEAEELEFEDLSTDLLFRVFQRLLWKKENTGPHALDEIVVMGAFTCSRMRAGEFGGWVARVTRGGIQHTDTYGVLEEWRNGPPDPLDNPLVQAAAQHFTTALTCLRDLLSGSVDAASFDTTRLTSALRFARTIQVKMDQLDCEAFRRAAPEVFQDNMTFTDRADTDGRANRFRQLARSNGFDVLSDCMPWAEGAGIVHMGTWNGEANLTDSVYVSWEFCCWDHTLSADAREVSGDNPDIVDGSAPEVVEDSAEGSSDDN